MRIGCGGMMSRGLADLLIGRLLADRYEIQEAIGRGGMSIVYRATDRRLGRPVAVKVVSLPTESDEVRSELRDRLRREAASAARIPPHPNVVQVYDYGTDPALDLDFIAMELVEGRDLKTALRESAPPLEQGFRVLREAARGVAAGHRAGIVHRDVKPANIVLTGREQLEGVKILDFGIAKALVVAPDEDLTRTGLVPHSPAYASPEQLRGESSLTPASDVYQLGLVGYELLAGERAFAPEQREQLGRGLDATVLERGRWGAVPRPVREVVERALHVDPAARFPDAAAFAEALSDAIEHSEDATALIAPALPAPDLVDHPPASAPLPPPASAPPTASARGRALWRGWADPRLRWAGAALLALALVWALARGGGDPAPVEATATPEMEEIDAQFRGLVERAYENLQEQASPVQGPEAASAVEALIEDLNEAWVKGDLQRHLAHYAERVRYNGRRVGREHIATERNAAIKRYPRRSVALGRRAITFPRPGRARALVDREWDFRGDDERWEGASRQELELELSDGKWQIVSEQELEVYRSSRREA